MSIRGLEQAIRDHIDEPRTNYVLRGNRAAWSQITSSLDVIGDTDLAMHAYLDQPAEMDFGDRYIATYGVLQALFLQQDAVFNLCAALSRPKNLSNYPRLKEIRNVRNDSIGHPTRRDHTRTTSYHYISRMSLKREGFTLLSFDDTGVHNVRDVSVLECIEDQGTLVEQILGEILVDLNREQTEQKAAFMNDKLESSFPETLSYGFQKLFEGASGTGEPTLGLYGTTQVRKVIGDLRTRLEARGAGLDTYGGVEDKYRLIEYALQHLEIYLNGQAGSAIADQTEGYIFASFLREQVESLRSVAQEIDDAYAS